MSCGICVNEIESQPNTALSSELLWMIFRS